MVAPESALTVSVDRMAGAEDAAVAEAVAA